MNVQNRPSVRTAEAGFTLIEIMVVIVILGLLATLVVPNIIQSADEARVTKAQTDCKTIEKQVSLYRAKKGRMPESLDTLTEPDDKGVKYLDELPKDPWDNDYVIKEGDKRGDFEIISYGPDGQEGGDDDISSRSRKED